MPAAATTCWHRSISCPGVAEELAPYEPVPETRALRWGLREPAITRPYTDLAY